MEKILTIAEMLYSQIVNGIFGEIPDNIWYTANLDVIRGIVTVVLTSVVLLLCVIIVVAVMRFIGSLFHIR